MDITALISSGLTALITGVGLLLYFRPKLKKLEAETEKTNLENIESVLDTLTAAYEKRLEITEGNYTIEINGVRRQHEILQREVDALSKKLVDNAKEYKVDRELLAIYKKAAEKMKSCPTFDTCIGAKEFHTLMKP